MAIKDFTTNQGLKIKDGATIRTGSIDLESTGLALTKGSIYLKDDGVIWINIGDTFAGSGGAGGDFRKGKHASARNFRQSNPGNVCDRSLCLVPAKLAVMMVDNHWILRRDIIWDKGVVKPEDPGHTRRPGTQHEYVYMFAKNRGYKYHPEYHIGSDAERGDVWHIAPNRVRKKSLAPMPDELARRCIELCTNEGDIVFDPFAGSGTVGKVAMGMGRVGIGMDLYGGKWL